MDELTLYIIKYSSWLMPALIVWLLARCTRSMLREKYEPEIWAYLETPSGETAAIRHFECIIGTAKSCDVVINRSGVGRTHASLIRSGRGVWRLYDLGSGDGSFVNGKPAASGQEIKSGDTLTFGGVDMTFRALSERERSAVDSVRSAPGRFISPGLTMLILTVFQALLTLQLTASVPERYMLPVTLSFAAMTVVQWCYYFIMRAIDRTGFEVETLAFFLSTLGMAVAASSSPEDMLKQLSLLMAGIVFYLLLGWWLRDIGRTKAMRWPVAAAALCFLALNLLAGETSYGASNWLRIGGITLQPSEFVKVAYIYVGAATLDRLFRRRNLFAFIAFSAVCVGALALMGDFGTALIFFVTFLVISFMRSGSFATVFLAVAGAALGVMLVLTAKPYIAQRFAAWGHVWDDPLGAGWQQTRALSAAASGGLFGVGAGKGWLRDIFAADTDMVFCMICEELGLITALCAVLAIVLLALFTVRSAAQGRSSFYVIAACAASSMMMVQLALNVFGSVDLLPFTGVTFPFVSKGGSSLISCWGLLSYIKASDTRQNASFSVKRSSRAAGQKGGTDR